MALRGILRTALRPQELAPQVPEAEEEPHLHDVADYDIDNEVPPPYTSRSLESDSDDGEPMDIDDYIETEDVLLFAQQIPAAPEVERSATRVVWPEGERPRYPLPDTYCLSAYVTINGLQALALFDSGSTGVSLTPDFARVARVPLITLTNPLRIQLGCVGSRSAINFGATVDVEYGPIREQLYVDIVNVERYDMIIGVPWLYRHDAVLDFTNRTIQIRGQPLDVLSPGEEAAAVVRRAARKRERLERRTASSNTRRAPTPSTSRSSQN